MFIVSLASLPLAYSSRLSLFKSKSRINTDGSNKNQKRNEVRVTLLEPTERCPLPPDRFSRIVGERQ